MRVAFDTSATFLNPAGTSTYINEILLALNTYFPEIETTQISYPYFFNRKRQVLRKIDSLYRETIWTQYKLPSLAKKFGVDILHSPAFLAPCTKSIPIVVTIYDLYTFRNPQAFTSWQKYSFNYWIPKVVNSAQKIIAISNFTKSEILSIFPSISENKISVTPLGVNSRFAKCSKEDIENFKIKYNLTNPFILSISTIEPRKNLHKFLEAFSLIKDKIGHDLVLIGKYGWKSEYLYKFIQEKCLNARIKLLGYIPIEELPVAYNSAELFCFISSYEGFGLPPLEAMACGCPVLVSNAASLPEVVGDAAIKLDSLKIEEIANAIKNILIDSELKNDLSIKGIKQSKKFTWEKCAKETINAYNSI